MKIYHEVQNTYVDEETYLRIMVMAEGLESESVGRFHLLTWSVYEEEKYDYACDYSKHIASGHQVILGAEDCTVQRQAIAKFDALHVEYLAVDTLVGDDQRAEDNAARNADIAADLRAVDRAGSY